ncbi:MAG: UvrD-helicase domain-containing protein [Staphylococcus sp.]|nr:UvrD-helicase domain-containing protein [Staphylococcus sp.]
MINIYKASAGSGKTYTLAREYIKLILGHKDESGNYHLNKNRRFSHRSVLAITFTNKATEEMKTRIIHELAVIARLEKGWEKESPYAVGLCECFNCSKSELAAVAATALKDLLYDFNFFSVSTIDSFFQTILRSFAREAEVAGNYELELNDKTIIGMSVDKLLQDLNHGAKDKKMTHLVNWLTSYMTQLIEDGKSFNIFNRSLDLHVNLIKFIDKITDDTYREHEKELLDYLSDNERFNRFKDCIYNHIRQISSQTAKACADATAMIESSGMKDFVLSNIQSALTKWSATGYIDDAPSKTLMKAADDIRATYKKATKKSPVPSEELDGCIAHALDMIKFSFTQVTTLRIISNNLYQLGLLSYLAEYIDKYRRENSTILLSDTNALISKIIGDEDAPFLYERVGVWFKHYLIDEFQDTSFSQWSNIRPLIGESLSYDHDNLVIGDEKQCIYRFRNSDPSLLHNLHTDEIAIDRCDIRGNTLAENTNWRSSADVVRFNNTFFSALVKNVGLEEIYLNVAQQVSEKHISHSGYVTVDLYDGRKKEEWLPVALDKLTTNLRRELESGYKPGEIAILVRKGAEGEIIIRHLEETVKADPTFPHFRIVSDNSLMLGNSPVVSLIVSRLRLISATNFSTSPKKKTKRELAALMNRFENEKSLGQSSATSLLKALSAMDDDKTDIVKDAGKETVTEKAPNSVDLISLVEQIIADFVPLHERETSNLYLNVFQDLVTEFVGRGHGDIRSFLKWWDEKGNTTPVAGAQDDTALNILTIHKSKGLEYPCVHIPFAELSEANIPEPAWFKLDEIPGVPADCLPPMLPLNISSKMLETPFKEKYEEVCRQKLLDRVNLLYVAFTRAVNELHIGLPVSASGQNMAKEIIDAINACTPDFCSSLETTSDRDSDSISPYMSFGFEDQKLTIGVPTSPEMKHVAEKTALRPAGILNLDTYPSNLDRDIWANTCLEEKYYNIDDARDRGVMLHDTMASIRHSNDVEMAINSLRHSRKAKELTTDDIAKIHDIILNRVNDPHAARWFNDYKRVLIERPIAIGGDDTRRPDRVVWTADGHIDIIDFKSGSQDPRRYMKQVREYITLYESIGHSGVRGYLYYLDSGRIVEVETTKK